jgi:hypothetical protein
MGTASQPLHDIRAVRIVVVALAVAAWRCDKSSSLLTSPSPRPEPPPIAAPVGPAEFPPVSKPGRIYGSAAPLNYPLQPYTLASRFVLHDDGTFVLQYGYPRAFEYRGTYKESGSAITFEWEGWSTAGPWGATGSLGDKALIVRYNEVMMLTDFEDAIYSLVE